MSNYQKKFFDRYLNIKKHLKQLEDDDIYDYVINLERQTARLMEIANQYDFWDIFPKVLAIDSKLSLLEEMLKLDQRHLYEGKELIEMIEEDYVTYNKENFGYKINERCSDSIIFYPE